MSRFRFRRPIAALHRYCGLFLILLVVQAGLTGSLLVFGHEIDRWLNPELLRVTPVAGTRHQSLAAQWQAATAYLQDTQSAPWQPVSMTPPDTTSASASLLFRQPDPGRNGKWRWRQVLVDPYEARVLGDRDRTHPAFDRTGFIRLLAELHGQLLLGEVGLWLTACSAFLWALTTLLGLCLGWPGRGKLYLALGIKRGAGAARFGFDLHRATGFYTAPVLLCVALTGLYMAQPGLIRPLVAAISPLSSPVAPGVRSSGEGVLIAVDLAVDAAQAVFPEGEVRRIGLPRSNAEPYAIGLRLPAEVWRHGAGRSVVWIDPLSAEVLGAHDATRGSAGEVFLGWMTPLHTGVAFGLPGRLLVACSGLAGSVLAVAGLSIWLRKRRRHRRPRVQPGSS